MSLLGNCARSQQYFDFSTAPWRRKKGDNRLDKFSHLVMHSLLTLTLSFSSLPAEKVQEIGVARWHNENGWALTHVCKRLRQLALRKNLFSARTANRWWACHMGVPFPSCWSIFEHPWMRPLVKWFQIVGTLEQRTMSQLRYLRTQLGSLRSTTVKGKRSWFPCKNWILRPNCRAGMVLSSVEDGKYHCSSSRILTRLSRPQLWYRKQIHWQTFQECIVFIFENCLFVWVFQLHRRDQASWSSTEVRITINWNLACG